MNIKNNILFVALRAQTKHPVKVVLPNILWLGLDEKLVITSLFDSLISGSARAQLVPIFKWAEPTL